METFASNENNHVLYYDFPFYKKVDKNGAIIDLKNSDALSQAVKIWLVSKPNEKIRSRGGGILYRYLGKIMDDDKAKDIQNAIAQGLEKEFVPSLTVVQVTVVPNYDKQRWEIGIVAYNETLAIGVNTKVIVSNLPFN